MAYRRLGQFLHITRKPMLKLSFRGDHRERWRLASMLASRQPLVRVRRTVTGLPVSQSQTAAASSRHVDLG